MTSSSTAPRRTASPPLASVNPWGDLVCPNCGINIMAPPGCIVVPADCPCPLCRKPFVVSAQVAGTANARAGAADLHANLRAGGDS